MALVAEPGVGKSRLLWEVTQSARAPVAASASPPAVPATGWSILETSAFSYGQATSWLPVVGLLESCCRIERSDDLQTIREKVAGRILGLDPSLASDVPALLALLNVSVDPSAGPDHAAWAGLDPPRRRRQTLDALQRLLIRASQERPLLLIFEDLHWIDSETQTFLDELVASLPSTSIALLVSYRPEYQHTWTNRSWYTQIRVEPLAADGAATLLDLLLGTDPSVQPLATLLTARTAGNPFFLEESVRTLVENGALVGEAGAYHLIGQVDDVKVPSTVQAVLAARIDRLAAGDKRLLQTAAVIGKELPRGILQATFELPDQDLQSGLARLQAAEMLYPTSLFPNPSTRSSTP